VNESNNPPPPRRVKRLVTHPLKTESAAPPSPGLSECSERDQVEVILSALESLHDWASQLPDDEFNRTIALLESAVEGWSQSLWEVSLAEEVRSALRQLQAVRHTRLLEGQACGADPRGTGGAVGLQTGRLAPSSGHDQTVGGDDNVNADDNDELLEALPSARPHNYIPRCAGGQVPPRFIFQ